VPTQARTVTLTRLVIITVRCDLNGVLSW